MSTDRVRYQHGTVEFHEKTGKYYLRYRDADRRRRSVFLGTINELSTAAKIKRAVDAMRVKVNAELGAPRKNGMTMAELIEKYRAERMPKRRSTARGYNSKLKNHIIPRWGNTLVSEMMTSAYPVEQWLKSFDGSPKSKVHLRGILSVLLDYAMLVAVVPIGRNPMELVRIEDASKRLKDPTVLTYEQFGALLSELREPFRTMALLGGVLGLRCSEFGLKWKDLNFEKLTLTLRQAVVNGHEDDLKTPASKSVLPIAPELAEALLRWRSITFFKQPQDWVFASPFTLGRKPYHTWSAQNQVLSPAGVRAGIGPVGWHDLRHSYRTWLDQTGAPVGVQKDCLRHSSIATTMNIYGAAEISAKREAHGSVVEMLKKAAVSL